MVSRAFAADVMRDDAIHVGVVQNTYNSIIDMSPILVEDLKKYCTTFFIETDDERAYINALVPRRNMIKAYNEYITLLGSSSSSTNAASVYEKERAYKDALKVYEDVLKYFPKKSEGGVREYLVAPREAYFSEFVFKDRIPVDYARYTSTKFDVKALFEENHLVARIIANENDFDILVIPSSLVLSSTLIRLRLKVYNRIEDKYYTIFDKIVPISTANDETDKWVIQLAEHISSKSFALYSLEPKDYAVSVKIDDEIVGETGVVLKGEHKVNISSPGRVTSEFTMNFEEGKINTIKYELYRHEYKNLFITTPEVRNAVISIDDKEFLLPRHFDKFETPFNYSVSALGYVPLSNSITEGEDDMNYKITLRPEWSIDRSFGESEMRKFYTALTVTLGLFAIDIGTKAFKNASENPAMWSSLNTMSTSLIYASLGVVFGTMVDYFIASKYSLY